MSDLVVAVTGHRPNKLGGYKIPNPTYDLVVYGLAQAFDTLKPGFVISGMAIGVDQWAAEIAVNMSIPFVAAIPFANQEKMWPPHVQAKYHWLLARAYAQYVICDGEYEAWKMQKRNEWMIDSCQQVVAVWDGTPGGTANCVAYAVRAARPIYYVPLPAGGMVVGSVPQLPQSVQLGQEQSAQAEHDGAPFIPKRIIDL